MSGKRLPSIILTLLGFLSGIILGVLGNFGPDSIKLKFQNTAKILGLSDEAFWIVSIVALSLFGLCVVFLKDWYESRNEKNRTDAIALEREGTIDSLIESYETRLAQKLDQRITLTIDLKYTKEGTSEVYAENYFAEDAKTEKEIQATLAAILNKHESLLLIGKPGSGKTTLLLNLAIAFLKNAKSEKSMPYPIILDLSSWQIEKSFVKWYEDVLINGYGFSSKVVSGLIEDRKLIPFLDGLDEIPNEEMRRDCLQKLHQFRKDYEPNKLVISSRINEYANTNADAPVRAEVLVKKLTKSQVNRVLQNAAKQPENNGRSFANPIAARNMLLIGNNNAAFKEIICTPIYFNLSSQIFDTPMEEIDLPIEEEKLQSYLVKAFIEKQLAQTTSKFSSRADNLKYLSWLADSLFTRAGGKYFELVTFRPDYLLNEKRLYWINALVGGIGGGLSALCFIGVSYFVIFSILGAAMFKWSGVNFELQDTRVWDSSRLKSPETWLVMLIVPAILCFVIGLPLHLFTIFWARESFTSILYLAIFSEGVVATGVNESLRVLTFTKIRKPYQRITTGLVYQSVLWGFAVAIGTLVMRISGGVTQEDILWITGGFLFGTFVGIFQTPLYSHLLLRFCFYLEGTVPVRFVDFLNYMTELKVLERDGGRWSFRHKIIQDHLRNTG